MCSAPDTVGGGVSIEKTLSARVASVEAVDALLVPALDPVLFDAVDEWALGGRCDAGETLVGHGWRSLEQ
jgi:hypothetical protein